MRSGVFRRVVALLALGAWLGGLLLPALGFAHTFEIEDLVRHESLGVRTPVAQFEQVPASASDGHCAVCHLQRAARGAALAAPAALAVADLPAFETAVRPFLLAAAETHLLPSRAPPSPSIS